MRFDSYIMEYMHTTDTLNPKLLKAIEKIIAHQFDSFGHTLGHTLQRRFNAIDQRFDAIDRRFNEIEVKQDEILDTIGERFEDYDGRISALENNTSTHP